MTHNDDLDDLLRFDPLYAAETLTGHSYKEDDQTQALGLSLHLDTGVSKRKALKATGDTHLSSSLAEQLEVMESLGFETVLLDSFEGSDYGLGSPEESYRIMWHPEGVLATVESYQGLGRNSTKFYYNVRFSQETMGKYYRYTSSGHFHTYDQENENYIWVGNHDGREAFKHHLTRLGLAGEFLSEWIEQPFLWLLTYTESKVEGYDYEAINEERISRLPKNVRNAITPQES